MHRLRQVPHSIADALHPLAERRPSAWRSIFAGGSVQGVAAKVAYAGQDEQAQAVYFCFLRSSFAVAGIPCPA